MNLTSYVLDDGVALAELARDIESAARSGGAFVAVRTSDGVDRSVLITPSMVVEIEPLELADDPGSASAESDSGSWETHSVELATFSGLEPYEVRRPSYFSW